MTHETTLKTATRNLTPTEAYWLIEFGNPSIAIEDALAACINNNKDHNRCWVYGGEIEHKRGLGRSKIECWEVRSGLWLWRVVVRMRKDISKRWNSPVNQYPLSDVVAVGIADDRDEGLRLSRAAAWRAAKTRKQQGVA